MHMRMRVRMGVHLKKHRPVLLLLLLLVLLLRPKFSPTTALRRGHVHVLGQVRATSELKLETCVGVLVCRRLVGNTLLIQSGPLQLTWHQHTGAQFKQRSIAQRHTLVCLRLRQRTCACERAWVLECLSA